MSNQIVSESASEKLAQVMIASPCSIGWENMTGDDRIRHCGECKKSVYNTSLMSVDEILVVTGKADACLRIYRRADGTMMVDDCPKALRPIRDRIRAASKIAASVCGLLISFSSAFAQGVGKTEKGPLCAAQANSNAAAAGQKSRQKADNIAAEYFEKAQLALADKKFEAADMYFKKAIADMKSKQHDPAFVNQVHSQYIASLRQRGLISAAANVEKEWAKMKTKVKQVTIVDGNFAGPPPGNHIERHQRTTPTLPDGAPIPDNE